MKTRLLVPLARALFCITAPGLMGSPILATSAGHEEIEFAYNSPATVGEAQRILEHLELLKPGSYKRGNVDAATREALLTFQRTHTLRPTGRVDGETLTQLLQHEPVAAGSLLLKGVRFDAGSSQLDSESLRVLDRVARSLRANPHVRVEISGHADSTGTAAVNDRLSKARADAVRDYLVGQGVSASRLETRSHGSSRPIADNDTRTGRAENRRVDLARLG